MTIQIPLNHGLFAIIDDRDFELVNQHTWWAKMNVAHLNNWYAYTSVWNGKTNRTVYMHRLILGEPAKIHVDHIDRDTLNNTRANLRTCTHGQNMANKIGVAKSGFKGVYKHKLRANNAKPYMARCNDRHLGYFATAEEAARVYDAAALAQWGEFARTNFPRLKMFDEA